MARGISLAPVGLVVERLETTADKITVLARPSCETAACPNCAQVSKSVHSRYQRSLVGIDDWAWKRGHRYGTIICDLEQRRIVDILPDREAATVATWLAEHSSIIARDRGAGFIQAATQAGLKPCRSPTVGT